MVYLTIGIDGKRCRKIQKDRKRYEKIAEDGGCVGECGFSCVASAYVLLNCRFPYLGGRGLCQVCFCVSVPSLNVVDVLSR